MSDYRDDTNEIAVASSNVWMGLASSGEGTAFASDEVMNGLLVLMVDTVIAADTPIERQGAAVIDAVGVSDEVTGKLSARYAGSDSARASGAWRERVLVLTDDSIAVADVVIERLTLVETDTAHAYDEAIGLRIVRSMAESSAKISDQSLQASLSITVESASVGVEALGRSRLRSLIDDTMAAAGIVIDGRGAATGSVSESAMAADQLIDRLHATQVVISSAEIMGSAIQSGERGQAWTASVDSWAMSRYAPFTFTGLAVIDGRLYGTAEDGVYLLGANGEIISGEIRTGKLDVSGGALATPHCAYMEYELDGSAEMDVTTTQAGASATYTYGLPAEFAGELTNGRFVFGRGLRGRHFTFALRLTGTHGHINDLSVETAQTKRRV